MSNSLKFSATATIERYLRLHALACHAEDLSRAGPQLRLCIVIPCMAERKNIGQVLDSLEKGSQRLAEAEVILVANNSEHAAPEVVADNLYTLQDVQARPFKGLRVLTLDYASPGKSLPRGKAGVGLARRLGMDLALRRLVQAKTAPDGAIASLDADSVVAPGYIDRLLEVFTGGEKPLGGICAYAHPLPADDHIGRAILHYELWMRYYELGLRWSGSLFAYPAIGSCLVVSAGAYAMADGMPVRQAGEDFYFWQKIVKLNGLRPLPRLAQVKVFPAVRSSSRMPFGTSRALYKSVEEGYTGYKWVEPPSAFNELKRFFCALPQGFADPVRMLDTLPPQLRAFLHAAGARGVIKKFRKTYPTLNQFTLAVHRWFDGLKVIRFINQCARTRPRVWILDALREVLRDMGKADILSGIRFSPALEVDNHELTLYLQALREQWSLCYEFLLK